MTDRILVPVDGSEQSRRAFDTATTMFDDAEFVVLHVIEPYDVAAVTESAVWDDEFVTEREREAETVLDEFRDLATELDVDAQFELTHGRPSRAILEAIGEFNVDHVVMGSRGRRRVARVLLGSVAETVTKRAPVAVTIVRPGEGVEVQTS